MYQTVYNPSDQPVVLDASGRSVGGGEWATAQSTDDTTKAALASGQLVVAEPPAEDAPATHLNPQAVAAFETTARYGERSEQIKDYDKAALEKVARREGLIGEDDDLLVGELRSKLVESDRDLTKTRSTTSPAAAKPADKTKE